MVVCLSILGTIPCQNFWCAAMTRWWTTPRFSANPEYALAIVWFLKCCCRYLRNSCVVSLTDSSQLLARSAKILCSDSEAKATNTDIRFEDLAIDAWRFLSFVSSSRIPPLLLAMLLLVIWFQATSVSLGDLASGTFGLSSVPSSLASNCPLVWDLLRPCTLLGGEGTVSGTRGGGISGEYGDTIFVENGMKSNYGVWIWLGKTRIDFQRKLGYRNFQFRMSKRIHGNSAETSGINFRVPRKFLEIADR